jgi:hypothetical protein
VETVETVDRTKTVDFKQLGIEGLDVQSVTVRVVNGEDSLAAAARCLTSDGKEISGPLFGMMMRQQIVAQAIVEVDGKPVVGACCVQYPRWSNRTRDFVGEVFDFLNEASEEEKRDFRKALAGSAVAPQKS